MTTTTTSNRRVLLLAGDGIGPEVAGEARRVVEWLDRRRTVGFDLVEAPVGGAAYEAEGHPLPDATLAAAAAADAVLLGAVGGPQWDTLEFSLRPERAVLGLRKNLDLFANLRPARVFDALSNASSLKPEILRGLDLVIIRELTGGIYFGEPRGVETLPDGTRRGINTEVYTTPEIRRVGAVAFELARERQGKVHSVEKANVMESGGLWREEIQDLHDADYGEIELHHMYADNCAMQLVRDPHQFDVVVTGNLFGDLLSDISAQLTGSLGMLPSASLGPPGPGGRRAALYEPVHGSAPDIAGEGTANPIAMVLSLAMLLRHSLGREDDADLIERAVGNVLDRGLRTADIAQPGLTAVSTEGMGRAICAELDRLAA